MVERRGDFGERAEDGRVLPHRSVSSPRPAEPAHFCIPTELDQLQISPSPQLPISTHIAFKEPATALPPPLRNTPSPSSHRRRLRLTKRSNTTRKPRATLHKASVDDYDKKAEKKKEEPVVYPLITYDPGLLDVAVIVVSLSRTQTMIVSLR